MKIYEPTPETNKQPFWSLQYDAEGVPVLCIVDSSGENRVSVAYFTEGTWTFYSDRANALVKAGYDASEFEFGVSGEVIHV